MAELSTQEFLELQDIREGVLILKDGSIRGVMMVSSINFALKSDEEQDAIIYAFQSFLNSLDFSCQIVIQSRNINITPYLDTLKDLEDAQTNKLLKEQISSYREFIKNLVVNNVIMTKQFFLVVPYSLGELFGAKAVTKQISFLIKSEKQQLSDADFQRCKVQLWQRMEYLAMGLRRCGLEAIPLTTPELIELFWALHHPEQAEKGYYPQILPELLK